MLDTADLPPLCLHTALLLLSLLFGLSLSLLSSPLSNPHIATPILSPFLFLEGKDFDRV